MSVQEWILAVFLVGFPVLLWDILVGWGRAR